MSRATGDVTLREEIGTIDALGPIDHRQRRAHRPVRVEDLYSESLGPEIPLYTRKRSCCLSSEERAIGEVARQRGAGEIVRRRVAEVDDDTRIERPRVGEKRIGDRVGRDLGFRGVDGRCTVMRSALLGAGAITDGRQESHDEVTRRISNRRSARA